MSGEPEEHGYSLVMPFVVCVSNGGTYEDQAFVAGVKLGHAMEQLERDGFYHGYVYPALVPQMDLLAMDKGLPMTSEPWDEYPDEYVYVVIGEPDQ